MRFGHWFVIVAAGATWVTGAAMGCGSDDTGGGTATTGGGNPCDPTAECTTVKSDCMALVDNASADKAMLRFSELKITGPKQLAEGLVSDLIAKAVRLDSEKCNLSGTGFFSWLMVFDTKTGDLRTGGAKPSTPEAGYCFVNETLGTTPVAPLEAKGVLKDGKFASTMGINVVVPIYLSPEDAMMSGKSYVLLPLSQATMEGTLSPDFNCVGTYNAANLKPEDSCLGNADVPHFITAGSLKGFITLEDADTVDVDQLGETLCVLLSGDAKTYGDGMKPAHCKRDASMKIVLQGDWDATTNMAGGAKDAFALGAEFAASAVKNAGDPATGNCK